MKIAILSAANNVHTARWANGLSEKGHDVILLSIHPCSIKLNASIKIYKLPYLKSLGYLLAVFKLIRILKREKPDIVNAHYATGYGFLARISRFKPVMLSVWGSDVYLFPEKSILHRWFLRANLKYADSIGSTSHCMKSRIEEILSHQKIFITSFGIDTAKFGARVARRNNDEESIVIGTVKSLKYVYGVDILLRAFAEVYKELGNKKNLSLVVYGKGDEFSKLEKLANELEVRHLVEFGGHIDHREVPKALKSMDIYVALSRSESFGVAVLEASSCGVPVVVSDTPGLQEVVINSKTGLIVPSEDVSKAAEAIKKLVLCPDLRFELGKNGRKHVIENYTWNTSLEEMISAYEQTRLES